MHKTVDFIGFHRWQPWLSPHAPSHRPKTEWKGQVFSGFPPIPVGRLCSWLIVLSCMVIVCGCFVVASASVHVALAGPKAFAADRVANAGLADVDPERSKADGFAIVEPHGGPCVMLSLMVAAARMECKDSPPTTLGPCKPRAPLGRCSGAAAVVRSRSAIASASA